MDFKPIIEVAQKATEPQIVERDGVTYFVSGNRELRLIEPPMPAPLQVFTLNSVIEYLVGNRDKIDLGTTIITVPNEECVQVEGSLHPKLRCREIFVKARNPRADNFLERTDDEFAPEMFNIMLRTTFDIDKARAGDLLKVQKFVGNIRASSIRINKDDGFGQQVSVAQGVARVGEASIENPVMLTPLVTFPEAQVKLTPFPFILRLHDKGPDAEPTISLRLADRHGWRYVVTEAVRATLSEMVEKAHLPVPVIG